MSIFRPTSAFLKLKSFKHWLSEILLMLNWILQTWRVRTLMCKTFLHDIRLHVCKSCKPITPSSPRSNISIVHCRHRSLCFLYLLMVKSVIYVFDDVVAVFFWSRTYLIWSCQRELHFFQMKSIQLLLTVWHTISDSFFIHLSNIKCNSQNYVCKAVFTVHFSHEICQFIKFKKSISWHGAARKSSRKSSHKIWVL